VGQAIEGGGEVVKPERNIGGEGTPWSKKRKETEFRNSTGYALERDEGEGREGISELRT